MKKAAGARGPAASFSKASISGLGFRALSMITLAMAVLGTVADLFLAQKAVLVGVERAESLRKPRHLRLRFVERELAVVVGVGFLEALIHFLLHVSAHFVAAFTSLLQLFMRQV